MCLPPYIVTTTAKTIAFPMPMSMPMPMHLRSEDPNAEQKRDAVVGALRHSWGAYERHAFGQVGAAHVRVCVCVCMCMMYDA